MPQSGCSGTRTTGCVDSAMVSLSPRVEELIETLRACHSITGLTLAVVKGNQSWTRGFGLADVERGINVTSSTLFPVASVSKAFTAALLAMLLEESRNVTWTTKLRSVLGEDFRLVDDVRTQETNLVDLLAHRMGLRGQNLVLFADLPASVTRASVVSRLRFLESQSDFRDGFSYNNWMYMLAGRVAEVLAGSGESWEALLKRRLLSPLSMTSTRVLGHDIGGRHPDLAQPYSVVEGRMQRLEADLLRIYPFEPAGALVSSAQDMVQWLGLVLGRGRGGPRGEQLLPPAALSSLTSLHNSVAQRWVGIWRPPFPASDVVLGYGLGWYISLYRGLRKLEHAGGLFAYSSNVCVFPDADIGIFLSINGMASPNEFARDIVCYVIADILRGAEPWLNASTYCTFPSPWKPAQAQENTTPAPGGPTAAREPSSFSGTYGHRLLGDVTVGVNASLGALVLTWNRLEAVLEPSAKANEFKGHLQGMLRFWHYSGTKHRELPVHFSDLVSGKYRKVELNAESEFSRDVRFDDSDANKGRSSLKSAGFVSIAVVLLMALDSVC